MAESTREGMPPIITCIFKGQVYSPDNIFISGEQELLLKISGKHTSALVTLLIYFVCNIQYRKERMKVYIFLQRYVLTVYDSVRLPTKVMQFLNELNCSDQL